MKTSKQQKQLALGLGLAALGTIAVLAVSPLGNFFMSSLFGSNPTVNDSGLYQGYQQTIGTGTYMRVGTGVHLGSNDTRYGTGSTMRLRAQVTLIPRSLETNSISGVISYNAADLSMSTDGIIMTGSGFTIDNAITRVVRNADGSEAGQFYFSIDKDAGNFLTPYHQFLTLEVRPVRTLPSYSMTLENIRYLDTASLALRNGDSLYLDNSTANTQRVPLVITPGTNYIVERVWDTTNPNEHHVEETLYNANDQRLSVTERVYDATDGHLLRETITEYGAGSDTPIREIYREYFPDGVTVRYERETVYNPDGTRTITERTYNPDGTLLTETTRTEGTPIVGDRPPVVTLGAVQGITLTGATFNWVGSNADAGETFNYRFCISDDANAVFQNCDASTTNTSVTRTNLLQNTRYYWNVMVSDGTTSDITAVNGPQNFNTLAPAPTPTTTGGSGGGSSGGGGAPISTPQPSGQGAGGGFSEFDQEFTLPAADDARSVIAYGPINFKLSDGNVRLTLRHIDKNTGWEVAYTKGTRVTNADGTGFTGIYNPLIRYRLPDLREPMRGQIPSDMTLAYEYLLQYGNLKELYKPNVTVKGAVGDIGDKSQLVILAWDFQQQKWVQIGDGNNIINGQLNIGINKSSIIGIFKKTTVTAAGTTGDICDDAKNPNRTPFRDANNHWATSFICKLYNLKAISGYTDGPFKGLFRPDNSVTRAELLKIMMAAEGIKVDTSRVNSGFPDVPTYEWFAPYVTTAKELRLVDGYPDGTFQPFKQINRSEALKIILNASSKINDKELADQVARYKTTPPSRSTFNDINTTDWFAPYIDLAAGKGIISGKSAGIFRAGDDMTRAEVSKVIQLVISLQ